MGKVVVKEQELSNPEGTAVAKSGGVRTTDGERAGMGEGALVHLGTWCLFCTECQDACPGKTHVGQATIV